MSQRFFLIILLTMGLLLSELFAEADNDSLKTYNLGDSIVVVGNHYETSLKNMAYNYQIIPADQVKRLAIHSALEVIDMEFPSAFVMEKKVLGYGVGTEGAGQLYLRGLGGQPNTGVLVLLNGHPDFMGIFGHPLPDVYGTDDIQQVEILSGPASTVFGSHAMGGVVNLITDSEYEKFITASFDGGTFNTYNGAVNISQKIGRNGLYFSTRYKRTDGHLAQTGFESFSVNGGWNYQINPNWSLAVTGRYVPYSFDDPARTDSADVANLGTYARIQRGTGEVVLRNTFSSLKGSVQLYTNLGHHRFYDGFESHDFAYGVSVYQFWQGWNRLKIAAGTDLLYYGGQAENPFAKLPNGVPIVKDGQQSYRSFGAYLIGFYDVTAYLNLKAGLRYQYHSLDIASYAPMASITFKPLPNVQIFAGYKSGFRFPTMREVYLFPSANTGLKQEEVAGVDAGVTYYWYRKNSVQITLYRNDVKNMIQLLPNPTPPPFQIFENNADKTALSGVEARLNFYPVRAINMQLAYAYLNPGELTAFNPKNQVKFLVSGQYGRFGWTFYGKYINALYAGNNQTLPLPDYLVTNLAGSYSFKNFTLRLKLLNLLNRKYEYLPGYEAPRFHLMAGVTYSL